jgi:PEP-CTERM motif
VRRGRVFLQTTHPPSGAFCSLASSTTFPGTFATLGLTPGTYVYNLTNELDNITLNIGSAVPEPSTLGLLGLGLLGLGVMRRRRRKINGVRWSVLRLPRPLCLPTETRRAGQESRNHVGWWLLA